MLERRITLNDRKRHESSAIAFATCDGDGGRLLKLKIRFVMRSPQNKIQPSSSRVPAEFPINRLLNHGFFVTSVERAAFDDFWDLRKLTQLGSLDIKSELIPGERMSLVA